MQVKMATHSTNIYQAPLCTKHCSRCLGYCRASEGLQAGEFHFHFSRFFEHEPWLCFPFRTAQAPHTCFFLPHRPAGGIGALSLSNIFLHPQEIAFRGLHAFPFLCPFFFLSGIFRNTCKIPRIKVCIFATFLSPLIS